MCRASLPPRTLLVELERVLAGEAPACASDPEAWFATTPEDVERAEDACLTRPAMTACGG